MKTASNTNAKGPSFDAWLETECIVARFQQGRQAFKAGAPITCERDVTLFHLLHEYSLHPACRAQ